MAFELEESHLSGVTEIILTVLFSGMNVAHLYLMVGPSNKWSEWSTLMLGFSLLHLGGLYNSLMVLWDFSHFEEHQHTIRVAFFIISMLEVVAFALGVIGELSLIYLTTDLVDMTLSAYLGYFLLLGITVIPQSAFTLIYEASDFFTPH